MIAESRKKESNRQVAILRGSPATLSVGYGKLAISQRDDIMPPLIASPRLALPRTHDSRDLSFSFPLPRHRRQTKQTERQTERQTDDM